MPERNSNSLDLPPTKDIVRRVSRKPFDRVRGVSGGLVVRPVRRRVAGGGERYDLDERGRPKQYLIRDSAIAQRPVFYRERVSPEVRLTMVLDLSRGDDRPSRRQLLRAAAVIGAAAMTDPAITLNVTTVGANPRLLPFSASGMAGIGLLRGVLAQLDARRLSAEPVLPQWLALAGAADPRAHVIVMTHYFGAEALLNVHAGAGGWRRCSGAPARPSG
ncbi:MAG: hypothetical protein E6J45_14745 [Chloroflexi bacterium]|nr:MAG: hypothetical protein E6J45_14745 [Chloroflexota bacterium]